jgi:hypothetical protein
LKTLPIDAPLIRLSEFADRFWSHRVRCAAATTLFEINLTEAFWRSSDRLLRSPERTVACTRFQREARDLSDKVTRKLVYVAREGVIDIETLRERALAEIVRF